MSLRDWSLWISALFHTSPWSPAEPTSWCMLRSDPVLSTLSMLECKGGMGQFETVCIPEHTKIWLQTIKSHHFAFKRDLKNISQPHQQRVPVSQVPCNKLHLLHSGKLSKSWLTSNAIFPQCYSRLSGRHMVRMRENMAEHMVLQHCFYAWDRRWILNRYMWQAAHPLL